MKKLLNGIVARVLLVSLAGEIVTPLAASALTSGPAQPEFSSFEPVNTTELVDNFTGAFTYNLPVLNIPGPNGGGYALSLSYHSGASVEEEASWVGYGWTLNPGAIVRNKRGFPDDYDGKEITYWNKVPANWTASVGAWTKLEAFSIDAVGLTGNASIRYNNYRGFSTVIGAEFSYKGIASLGYSLSGKKGSFSFGFNPAAALTSLVNISKKDESSTGFKATANPLALATQMAAYTAKGAQGWADSKMQSSFYGFYTFEESQHATNVSQYDGTSVNFRVGVHTTPSLFPVGPEWGLNGNYSQQTNRAVDNIPCYGYMYSADADDDEAMMDYYSEKESVYTKRDYFLSVPFSNADHFMVTGEGIGGGFRLHSRTPGHFRPNAKSSQTVISQLGFSVHTGPLNLGSGLNIGLGFQTLDVGKWSDGGEYAFPEAGGGNEPYFFRFNNDLGGRVEYSASLDTMRAGVASVGGALTPVISADDIGTSLNNGERSGRSSYIGYHTNSEMLEFADPGCDAGRAGGIRYNAYSKYTSVSDSVDRSHADIGKGIGEFEIVNEGGMRYVYALPVYSRNERNLQYGLDGISADEIEQNYIAKKFIDPSNAEVVVGEERSAPYATTHLLTAITTPDYVDRTNNGPTSDDFGGYTNFIYKRTAGSKNKSAEGGNWYKWRIPYSGLLYERRSLSDPMDDVGGMISGEKELYYLDKVETKTHVAHFITSPREDAFQANHNEKDAAVGELQELNAEANQSQKLDKIELYARNADGTTGRLLQTVHFEYQYSLSKNLPNASLTADENDDDERRNGKLTLRKVWFEYNGVTGAKIAPYIFGYQYRASSDYADLPDDVERMYDPIISYGDELSAEEQNPDYDKFGLDRWGSYQKNGGARHQKFQTWVNQNPDREAFDPAAWQLKTIRLPSGGEIQVQYEQNDYRFVQDRPAMAMVSLKPDQPSQATGKYYLNVSQDLGIKDDHADNENDPTLKNLVALIKEQFRGTDKEKIYFKFLFPLRGESANFTNCLTEYITGYVDVESVGVDANGVYLELGGDPGGAYDSPREVCQDLFETHKSGNLRFGQQCEASRAGISNDMDPNEIVMALLAKLGSDLVFDNSLNCRAEYINFAESYLRIPLVAPKLGGGIRVKRLLMYDHGAEDGAGNASLYGSEYIYQDSLGMSSGVAVNEPSTGREENALITYLAKRDGQSSSQQIISGEDKEQFEGPIGESLLPGASVAYARVVTKNIFNGATNPGFKVSEFHTAREFPLDQRNVNPHIPGRTTLYTNIEGPDSWFPKIPMGLITYNKTNYWLTQGYRFVINSMHGQPKGTRSFAGDYSDWSKAICVSGQEYEYFAPGESVPMMYGIGDIRQEHPGKEEEIVFESRAVEDVMNDGSVEIDASLGIAGLFPIPYVTGYPNITYTESRLRTHVTSKVLRFPAIQKGSRVYRDGVWHTTSYVGFDPATGKPILSRETDGYHALVLPASSSGHDGSYYSYTIPAYQKYPSMGQRGLSERTAIQTQPGVVSIEKWYDSRHYLNFKFEQPGIAASMMARFTSGDLIRLKAGNIYRGLYQVGKVVGNRIELLPTSIDVGNTLLPELVNVEIVRSGRTNQLTAAAGSITTYSVMPAVTDFPVQ